MQAMPADHDFPSAQTAPPPVHVVVPWAVSLFEPCQQALARLDDSASFPRLNELLAQLTVTDRLEGDEYSPETPHARLWARQAGLPHAPEAVVPWAARLALQDGLEAHQGAWGLLTPCHWGMGHDHLTFTHPASLDLSEADSRGLLAAMAPLFEEDGWHIHWGAPTRWYVQHDSLANLPTAALDRVIGRNPDLWMPDHPQARLIKRLQAEAQMLFYSHPINDERQSRGLPPVNTFWLSGCGAWPGQTNAPALREALGPREALLQSDLPGWLAAWADLEATLWPELLNAVAAGQTVRLSLCGERSAITLAPQKAEPPLGAVGRLKRLLGQALGAPRPAQGLAPSTLLADL